MHVKLVFAILLGPVAAYFDTGESCDSQVNSVLALECVNPCTEGCGLTQVQTNEMEMGLMCTCDIIGPPAVCCKVARVGESTFQLVGGCSIGGCNSGECKMLIEVNQEFEIVRITGRCLQ